MVISNHINIQILFILTAVTIISGTIISDTIISDTILSDTIISDTIISDTIISAAIPIQSESWDFMKCGKFLN